MSNTLVHECEKLPYTNAGSAIAAGDVVALGNRIGIAEGAIAASTGTGELLLEGVHVLTSQTDAAWSIGDRLYWDTSALKLTKTANANTVNAGMAFAAKESSAATGQVLLDGSASAGRAAAITSLTDNSGGAAADNTIGAVTAPTALTDNGGGTADGTVAAMTASTALTGTLTGTANGSLVDVAASAGACAGGGSPSATNVDTAIATAVATIVSGVNEQLKEIQTVMAVTATFEATVKDNLKEVTTTLAAIRTAIVALTDANTENATKINEIITKGRAANLIDA